MGTKASQISGVSIIYSTVCSGRYQRKHQSSASLAIVRGIQRWPVNSPNKGPVTRKMFPLDDVIMLLDVSKPLLDNRPNNCGQTQTSLIMSPRGFKIANDVSMKSGRCIMLTIGHCLLIVFFLLMGRAPKVSRMCNRQQLIRLRAPCQAEPKIEVFRIKAHQLP